LLVVVSGHAYGELRREILEQREFNVEFGAGFEITSWNTKPAVPSINDMRIAAFVLIESLSCLWLSSSQP